MDTKSDEIVDFPGRSTSKVWKHFGFLKKEGQIVKDNAICRVCKQACKYTGGTSNLILHLEHKHGMNLKDDSSCSKQQPTISSMMSNIASESGTRGPLPSAKAQAIDKALKEFIIYDCRPLSTIEGSGFINLIKACEPRYKVPGRYYLTQQLGKMHTEMEGRMKDKFTKINHCAVTHDMWTSLASEAYSAVTCHFIDDSWLLNSLVLQASKVDGVHTAENIAQNLRECQDKWQLPTPSATSDNAANEAKAFRILGWLNLPCLGHNLNLAVRAALDIPEAAKIVAKGRKVVGYFHKSPTATSILIEKQKLLLPKELQDRKLIQDVVTRWNSTLAMLERLLEITPAIHATLTDSRLKTTTTKFLYTFDDQVLIEAMISMLLPFKEATVYMSSESTPTLPLVWPTLMKINSALDEKDDDGTVIKKMKKVAQKNLAGRYDSKEDILLLSSLLHPRTKQLSFIDDTRRSKIQADLLQEITVLFNKGIKVEPDRRETEASSSTMPSLPTLPNMKVEPETEESSEQPKKKAKVDPKDWFDDVVIIKEEINLQSDPQAIARKELDRYFGEPASKDDPLKWWQLRESLYPHIASIAKKYLCIPASSVPSERVFSLAGHIVSKRRASLSADNVNMLIVLNKNYGKI